MLPNRVGAVGNARTLRFATSIFDAGAGYKQFSNAQGGAHGNRLNVNSMLFSVAISGEPSGAVSDTP